MGRDVEISRAARYSVWFYAIGQVLHVLGLFLAGGYGAPRKISGGAGIENLGAHIGLYGLGVGALAAVVGGWGRCVSGVVQVFKFCLCVLIFLVHMRLEPPPPNS